MDCMVKEKMYLLNKCIGLLGYLYRKLEMYY